MICNGKFKKGKDNLANILYRCPLGGKNSHTVKILALYYSAWPLAFPEASCITSDKNLWEKIVFEAL